MHRFAFVHDLNLLVHDYGESVDDESMLLHLERVYGHPEFHPDLDVLSLFQRTRSSTLTPQGLRQVAVSLTSRVDPELGRHLIAVVVGESKLGYGLARLYGTYADRQGTGTAEVFRSIAEAGDWLDAAHDRPPGTTLAAATRVLTDLERDPGRP